MQTVITSKFQTTIPKKNQRKAAAFRKRHSELGDRRRADHCFADADGVSET